MGKRTREIVALVLLALLGLIVLAMMGWYIFIGHNWNVAASNIDESVGQMDGYTVILFEGETLPQTERDQISDAQPMLDDDNRGQQRPSSDNEEPSEPVSIDEAASYYRQKGATVFILHPEVPDTYNPPLILNKNGLTLGLYYADGATSRVTAQLKAAELESREATFVILVVDDARLLEDPVSAADIIICNSDEDLSSHGEYHNTTFCVDSPIVGQVQTIIISPSRVLTSKTISWL